MDSFSMDVSIIGEEKVHEEIAQETEVPSDKVLAIREKAKQNVVAIINTDVDSPSRQRFSSEIAFFADATLESLNGTNKLIEDAAVTLRKKGGTHNKVSEDFDSLRSTISKLDPTPLKTGKINKIKAYFAKFDESKNTLDKMIETLRRSKQKLQNDCQALYSMQRTAFAHLTRLKEEAEMIEAMYNELERAIQEMKSQNANANSIKVLESDVLYAIKRKSVQLQASLRARYMDIFVAQSLITTNKDLVFGIDDALNITVPALRSTIAFHSNLVNQVQSATAVVDIQRAGTDLVEGLAGALEMQGGMMEALESSRNDFYNAIDTAFQSAVNSLNDISNFKASQLDMMKRNDAKRIELNKQGEAALQSISMINAIPKKLK